MRVWTVQFTWAKNEEPPPEMAPMRAAFLNDTPAMLDGRECRIVAMDSSIEWAQTTVRFSLDPV